MQLPYRSRLSTAAEPWTNASTFWTNNCLATESTNGVDLYARPNVVVEANERQQPFLDPYSIAQGAKRQRKHHKNELLDTALAQNIALPPEMTPEGPVEGSEGVAQFFMLNASMVEKPTGVLMLGSFSASSYAGLQSSLLDGLRNLKEKGAEQLIVDVVRASLQGLAPPSLMSAFL